MKSAEVYSVRAQTAHGFVWKWRSHDHARTSSMAFVSLEDCVADAQKSGYAVAAVPGRTS
ncbi:MAG: hypothetical protein ACXWUH_08035 [Burkholderiales bacterium]